MNKHAYLVMYHDQIYILEKLLLLLDDKRHDIYIHVDRKVESFDFDYYKSLVHNSSVYFVQRREVYWGHVSIIEAEFILFREAYSKGPYLYYHLLSGVDMPIKPSDYIYNFFESHQGKEFVFVGDYEQSYSRVQAINIFPKHFKIKNRYLKTLMNLSRNLLIEMQSILGVNRMKPYFNCVKFGSNWVSLTSEAIGLLLENEKKSIKAFRYSFAADEFYIQTIIYNSFLYDNVYKKDEGGCNMRAIDWERGTPYVYRLSDYDTLMNSDELFARKFSADIDKDIIDRIFETLSDKK